jgi:hypothetical protein
MGFMSIPTIDAGPLFRFDEAARRNTAEDKTDGDYMVALN